MLLQPTIDKMLTMKLTGMVQALEEQHKTADIGGLTFEDRLAMLVERQWLWKEDRAHRARLKFAQLKQPQACLEDVDYRHPRGLHRGMLDQIASSDWITYARNCIIIGPTGSGKSYLACALAQKACREGCRVKYFYAPKFFRQLQAAQVDGSLSVMLKNLAKTQLLVLDDFGLEKPSTTVAQYRDFLEVLDDRHGSGSTLITSQYPTDNWHEVIGEATVADAILDRLVHGAHRMEFKGESMRKPKDKKTKS